MKKFIIGWVIIAGCLIYLQRDREQKAFEQGVYYGADKAGDILCDTFYKMIKENNRVLIDSINKRKLRK